MPDIVKLNSKGNTPGKEALPSKPDRQQQIKERMKLIKNKIIVCSGKGGVGKTTVAVNLASALALQGKTVGILDIDITGPSVPKMLGIEGMRPELTPAGDGFIPVTGPLNIKVMSMAFLLESEDTPVIWRGPLKMSAVRQFLGDGDWGEIDYLIVDLPPGTGDEVLDIFQLIPDGYLLFITTPQDVALINVRKTVVMAKMMKHPMAGILENMAGLLIKCDHCGKEQWVNVFGKGGAEKAAKDMAIPYLGSIPLEVGIREQSDAGIPTLGTDPKTHSGKIFEEVITKVRQIIEHPSK
jgi:ATP-binding protein involved in chromosome partitioning